MEEYKKNFFDKEETEKFVLERIEKECCDKKQIEKFVLEMLKNNYYIKEE